MSRVLNFIEGIHSFVYTEFEILSTDYFSKSKLSSVVFSKFRTMCNNLKVFIFYYYYYLLFFGVSSAFLLLCCLYCLIDE